MQTDSPNKIVSTNPASITDIKKLELTDKTTAFSLAATDLGQLIPQTVEHLLQSYSFFKFPDCGADTLRSDSLSLLPAFTFAFPIGGSGRLPRQDGSQHSRSPTLPPILPIHCLVKHFLTTTSAKYHPHNAPPGAHLSLRGRRTRTRRGSMGYVSSRLCFAACLVHRRRQPACGMVLVAPVLERVLNAPVKTNLIWGPVVLRHWHVR